MYVFFPSFHFCRTLQFTSLISVEIWPGKSDILKVETGAIPAVRHFGRVLVAAMSEPRTSRTRPGSRAACLLGLAALHPAQPPAAQAELPSAARAAACLLGLSLRPAGSAARRRPEPARRPAEGLDHSPGAHGPTRRQPCSSRPRRVYCLLPVNPARYR